MQYTIKTPYKTVTRKRADSAIQQLLILAYEALAADGQLDTKAGHSFYNSVKHYINSQLWQHNQLIAELPNGQLVSFIAGK